MLSMWCKEGCRGWGSHILARRNSVSLGQNQTFEQQVCTEWQAEEQHSHCVARLTVKESYRLNSYSKLFFNCIISLITAGWGCYNKWRAAIKKDDEIVGKEFNQGLLVGYLVAQAAELNRTQSAEVTGGQSHRVDHHWLFPRLHIRSLCFTSIELQHQNISHAFLLLFENLSLFVTQ